LEQLLALALLLLALDWESVGWQQQQQMGLLVNQKQQIRLLVP
jgi:hypothetical protein